MNPIHWGIDVFANLRQLIRCRATHARVMQQAGIRGWRPGDYRPRGDTLYILATGRSILDLKPEDWDRIREGDSIALNLFLHSPFVPDVYLFEHIPDPEVRRTWLELLPRYGGDTPRLALLPSYCLERIRAEGMAEMEPAMKSVLGDRLRLAPVFFARHRSRGMLGFSRLLNRACWADGLYHLRGSLSSAVDFGLKHGFSRIVFCGVDLNGLGYFYGPRREKLAPDHDPDVPPVHYTDQRVHHLIPISAWLQYLVRSTPGVEFHCSSPASRLSDWMPVHPWPSAQRNTETP